MNQVCSSNMRDRFCQSVKKEPPQPPVYFLGFAQFPDAFRLFTVCYLMDKYSTRYSLILQFESSLDYKITFKKVCPQAVISCWLWKSGKFQTCCELSFKTIDTTLHFENPGFTVQKGSQAVMALRHHHVVNKCKLPKLSVFHQAATLQRQHSGKRDYGNML